MSTQSHGGHAPASAVPTLRSFELVFRPNVTLVSAVRRFVSDFYDVTGSDADLGSRVALATHELLENAVKYAADGETTLRVEVHAPGRVRVSTWNRAAPEHIEALQRAFAEIAAAADRPSFYQDQLRRTAKQTAGSGLGLARIFAEVEMFIHLAVDGDRVAIVAQNFTPEVTS